MKKILLLLSLLTVGISSQAQPTAWGLDSAFGKNGIVLDSFGNGNGYTMMAYDINLQADGSIVTVGVSINKYLADGKRDVSFGAGGTILLADIAPNPFYGLLGYKVHSRGNGKILVYGTLHDVLSQEGCVLQLKATGTVDSFFGYNGFAKLAFSEVRTSKFQADGSLLVAGTDETLIHLQKVKPDGRIDSSFGSNGLVTAYNGMYGGIVAGIDTLADGRILIAGTGYDSQKTRSAMLMRFKRNGTLDSSFNGTGIRYPFPSTYCRSMRLQKDGKILGAFGSLDKTEVVRFHANGTVDPSYGQAGATTLPFRLADMHLLSDGHLLCSGSADEPFVVTRLDSAGKVDSSFGTAGFLRTEVAAYNQRAYSMAVQADGKILVAGESSVAPTSDVRLTLLRYEGPVPLKGIASFSLPAPALFPNPATNTLSLTGIVPALFHAPYQLVSSAGQIVRRGTMPATTRYQVNIEGLPAGHYYIHLPHTALPFLKQ